VINNPHFYNGEYFQILLYATTFRSVYNVTFLYTTKNFIVLLINFIKRSYNKTNLNNKLNKNSIDILNVAIDREQCNNVVLYTTLTGKKCNFEKSVAYKSHCHLNIDMYLIVRTSTNYIYSAGIISPTPLRTPVRLFLWC